jgi:hypothetical protein
MIAHAIKVLERRIPKKGAETGHRKRNEVVGLWYLLGKKRKELPRLCAHHNVLLGQIRSIDQKLLLIRDKTHFHLDRRGVRDPRAIWTKADLTERQFEDGVDASLRLLSVLYKDLHGSEYPFPRYDGSDARRIAEHAYKSNLLSVAAPPDPTIKAIFDG